MNSASRLLAIYNQLVSAPSRPNEPAFDVWRRALSSTEQELSIDEGALAIQAFLAELDSVEAALEARGLPAESLYRPYLYRIRRTAVPTSLGSEWRSVAADVSAPEVRLPLAWAAAVLPSEEDEVPHAELNSLADEFDRLSEALAAADLPPAMRAFVTKQLRTLRSALMLYKVRGAVALKEAVQQAYGAATMSKGAMATEVASAPKARAVFERLNSEPPRVSRRLRLLRGWSHEEVNEVFA